MSKPFKFRYVNEIVGTFVLLVMLALVAGIILAGRAQDWFEKVHELQLILPAEGSLGLQKGAEVQILGTSVGRVERIRVRDDGSMSGLMTVKGDFIRFVRADSRALVKKKFGVAGDAFVEITKGQGAELGDEPALVAVKDTELTEIAQDILKQIQDATLPAIQEYTQLAADLRSADGPLMKLLAHLEQITGALERGEGSAGQLLRDPAAAQEIQRILAQVNAALAEVQKILADVKATTAQIPPMAAKVGREVDDLPGTVVQTQETIREAERLIEGIQQHWIIRKYVPQPQVPALIPAVQAGGP
jgi:phospholipid/cholesterol/gamma-HCH transport system substrate-binding protein